MCIAENAGISDECHKPLNISLSEALGMALGEKLFEESGEITGLKITKVHPIEGVTTEVSFTSEIRGEGRYPSGQSLGSGVMTKYPHGIIDGTWHGSLMIAKGGDQFMWWAHEKSKVVEGGNVRAEYNDRIYKFTKIILDE
jgi:hypothetical protein